MDTHTWPHRQIIAISTCACVLPCPGRNNQVAGCGGCHTLHATLASLSLNCFDMVLFVLVLGEELEKLMAIPCK